MYSMWLGVAQWFLATWTASGGAGTLRARAHLMTSLVRAFRPPRFDFHSSIRPPARMTATTKILRKAAASTFASIDLSLYDVEQSRLMDERCIVVDENDRAIGALDKKTCAFIFLD